MKSLALVALLVLPACKSGLPAAKLEASAFGVTVAIDSRPLTEGVSDVVKNTAEAVGVSSPSSGTTPSTH